MSSRKRAIRRQKAKEREVQAARQLGRQSGAAWRGIEERVAPFAKSRDLLDSRAKLPGSFGAGKRP